MVPPLSVNAYERRRMNSEKLYFIIYRVYNSEERLMAIRNTRLYGWTDNKKVLKAFLKQRDESKYTFVEMDEEEVGRVFSESSPPTDGMINYIKLKSSKTDEETTLFMTPNELIEIEKKIQMMFEELCSINNFPFANEEKEILYFVNLIMNIKEKYFEALYYIGYRPREIDMIFDHVDEPYAREQLLDLSYGHYLYPASDDISKIVIYSLESFVKVMIDDL